MFYATTAMILHEIKNLYLTDFNFCFGRARDLNDFQVVQKLESNNENEKNIENRLRIMVMVA